MIKTYVKGLGLLLALLFLGIAGFAAIGLITLAVFAFLLIVFFAIAIIALAMAPYYYAKGHKAVSKDFRIKRVRKKERL